MPKHIKNSTDLETPHESICQGFLQQASAKVEKAEPYIQEAKKLAEGLEYAKNVEEILEIPTLRDSLLTAVGFSEKALNILSEHELSSVLKKVLSKIFRGDDSDFRTQIVYRYLLTKGDSL